MSFLWQHMDVHHGPFSSLMKKFELFYGKILECKGIERIKILIFYNNLTSKATGSKTVPCLRNWIFHHINHRSCLKRAFKAWFLRDKGGVDKPKGGHRTLKIPWAWKCMKLGNWQKSSRWHQVTSHTGAGTWWFLLSASYTRSLGNYGSAVASTLVRC